MFVFFSLDLGSEEEMISESPRIKVFFFFSSFFNYSIPFFVHFFPERKKKRSFLVLKVMRRENLLLNAKHITGIGIRFEKF